MRKSVMLPIIVTATLVIGFFLGQLLNSKPQVDLTTLLNQQSSQLTSHTKLGGVLSLINSRYVENVNTDTLTEEFIQKILLKLDPHSSYIPASEAKATYEALEGSFEGIGVMFNMATDTVIIQEVISGGPSEKVGVLAGDRIITINDSIVAGRKVNQDSIVKQLKGERGTIVKVGIERGGDANLVPFEITRDKIPQKSIDAAFMITPEIGYIKLLRFARTSHQEFVVAVENMKKAGMKSLIFDLTDNSGGMLDQAIYITNEFLPEGNMIVYTEGINSPISKTFADGSGRLIGQPVVVLINEGSASASEIVSGALQDNDIGTIVGRRSFGKGLVQEQMPFIDGSLLNLTIARYHTPTGRCIQRPYDKGSEEYTKDFYKRFVDNELVNADSIRLDSTLKYTTAKGKIVYGGGGIMPDIFVPMDTTSQGAFFVETMNNNSLFSYSLRHVDLHRAELQTLNSAAKLQSYFDKNDALIYKEFLQFAKSKGSKERVDELSKKNCMIFLRGYIARNSAMSDNGFYLFMMPFNDIVKKGVEISSKGNF